MNRPFGRPWSLEGRKVLIVDDYAEMRSLVHEMIRSFIPERVVTANSGEQAIERMEQERFDLVLCDYNLGTGKDGQQVLEEARGRGLLPAHAVFIMITAENTSEMVMGAIEHLPDDYISKPFNRSLLASRIRRLVTAREAVAGIHRLLEQERAEEALQLCEARLREGEGGRSELLKLKGRILMRLGRYREAVDFHRALLEERDIPWASLALGEALFNLRDYEAAREVFSALVRDNPANVLARDWLARVLERLGQTGQALEVVQEALAHSPRSLHRQRELARLAYAGEDYELAAKAWRRVLELGTHSWYRRPDDFGGLARTLVRRGEPEAAGEVIGKMQRAFSPDDPATRLQQAVAESMICQARGDAEGRDRALDAAMDLLGENPTLVSGDTALELVATALAAGRRGDADELVRHLVRGEQEADTSLDRVRELYAGAGEEADLDAVIETTRKEVVAINNRGAALLKEGRIEESIDLFRTAARAMPANVTINLNAAYSLIMLMQRDGGDTQLSQEAREYLERVRRVDPGNAKYHRLSRMLGGIGT